jgi:hypothetical protein
LYDLASSETEPSRSTPNSLYHLTFSTQPKSRTAQAHFTFGKYYFGMRETPEASVAAAVDSMRLSTTAAPDPGVLLLRWTHFVARSGEL